jgi:phosphatidylglycerol:prolipoprotein diacylglycerol transferase
VLAPVLAALTAAVVVGDHGGLPFFTLHTFDLGPLPLQPFGIIVAAGVLIGAEVMRRYMLRFGVDEDDIRGLTLWLIVTGFIGAHVFDAVVYEHERLAEDPVLILKVWDGISSYGGFLGGALGYVFYVWWKRLTPGVMADASIVGLLTAFSIGRIGCTIVHDHIGRATTSSLGVDYPRAEIEARRLISEFPGAGSVIRAHNVAMYELAYLALVCAIVLPLAFQKKRRLPAGFIAVLVGLFYAPVRFFLEYWRLNASDPRYFGFTFAQWSSLLAFAAAGYAATWLWKHGKPGLLADELGGRPGGRQATIAALAKAKARGEPVDANDKKGARKDNDDDEVAKALASVKAEKDARKARAEQAEAEKAAQAEKDDAEQADK